MVGSAAPATAADTVLGDTSPAGEASLNGGEPSKRRFDWMALSGFIGNAVAIVAVGVSVCVSVKQLDLTEKALQNTLVYQMQKDEREVGTAFFEGRLSNTNPLFAVMQSVFIQWKNGSINPSVWGVFEKDYCQLLTSQRILRDWQANDKQLYSDAFVYYIDHLINPQTSSCKRAQNEAAGRT